MMPLIRSITSARWFRGCLGAAIDLFRLMLKFKIMTMIRIRSIFSVRRFRIDFRSVFLPRLTFKVMMMSWIQSFSFVGWF